MSECELGLIGLAVMGQNLALNLAGKGVAVAVYNRTARKTDEFMRGPAAGSGIIAARSIGELADLLERPRRVIVMVKAGRAVDEVIDQLVEKFDPGDLIMDGGNSHFLDTERRCRDLEKEGILYMGVGISGGEEGALKGPSIMAGGPRKAFDLGGRALIAASAKVDGEPCAAWLGAGGAGHLVKMVHNGIEYGYMQVIAEVYDLLARVSGLDAARLSDLFAGWNREELASFLVEITADIFANLDEQTGRPVVDVIMDRAGQKGTGRWTIETALLVGAPVPTLSAAVDARGLSARHDERQQAAALMGSGPEPQKRDLESAARDALFAAQLVCYAQGLAMLGAASAEYDYRLDLAEVAKIWRGGCIIRSRLLEPIRQALNESPGLPNLLLEPGMADKAMRARPGLAAMVSAAAASGVPAPALSASLSYLDSYRARRLPANLIQAQRDYFGAHTFERNDREGVFHRDWRKRS